MAPFRPRGCLRGCRGAACSTTAPLASASAPIGERRRGGRGPGAGQCRPQQHRGAAELKELRTRTVTCPPKSVQYCPEHCRRMAFESESRSTSDEFVVSAAAAGACWRRQPAPSPRDGSAAVRLPGRVPPAHPKNGGGPAALGFAAGPRSQVACIRCPLHARQRRSGAAAGGASPAAPTVRGHVDAVVPVSRGACPSGASWRRRPSSTSLPWPCRPRTARSSSRRPRSSCCWPACPCTRRCGCRATSSG